MLVLVLIPNIIVIGKLLLLMLLMHVVIVAPLMPLVLISIHILLIATIKRNLVKDKSFEIYFCA